MISNTLKRFFKLQGRRFGNKYFSKKLEEYEISTSLTSQKALNNLIFLSDK